MNLLKNPHLKAMAVFSALLLWLFVVGVENYVYSSSADLPVKVVDLGQNVSQANELPKVRVKYKNNGGGPVNINANELELFIDAGGLTDGLHNLPIQFSNKHPKIQVVAVEPPFAELKLEAITSRDIVVKTEVAGAPHSDYELRGVKAQVSSVTISGAASAIGELKELPLKLTLDGTETADFSRKIILEPPSGWKLSGQSVSFEPATVQVDVEIRKKKAELVPDELIGQDQPEPPSADVPAGGELGRKTLMAEIVLDAELQPAVREILPQNVLLTVEAEAEDLSKISNESIKLLIKNGDVQRGVYTVKGSDLLLPEGLDLNVTSISPAKVNIRF